MIYNEGKRTKRGAITVNYIGIDLGGTNVAAAVVNETGRCLGRASIPTPRGAEKIADAIAQAAVLACSDAGIAVTDARSVGVASAGSIDPEGGMVTHAFNLDLHNVPLAGCSRP